MPAEEQFQVLTSADELWGQTLTVAPETLPEGCLPEFQRWVSPEPAVAGCLNEEQVKSWTQKGFVLIEGLVPDDVILEARSASERLFPASSGAASADELRTKLTQGSKSVDSAAGTFNRPDIVFPYELPSMNSVLLHPNIINASSQLLGVTANDLRLTQSIFWAKYGAKNQAGKTWVVQGRRFDHGGDQPIHCDFRDNNLVVPNPDKLDTVSCIVYFDDSAHTGGLTGVVPNDPWVRSIWPIPGHQTPEKMPGLYDRECGVQAKPGTVLFYRHDTWHRGTAPKPGQLRRTMSAVFRRADADWVQFNTWVKDYEGVLARVMPTLSPVQRVLLGFPSTSSDYWTEKTIYAVSQRYPGIDMTPYRSELTRRVSKRLQSDIGDDDTNVSKHARL